MVGEARARLGCESRSTASELVQRRSMLLARLPPRLAAGLAWPVTHCPYLTSFDGCNHVWLQSKVHMLNAPDR